MKLSNVLKGTKAEKPVVVPGYEGPDDKPFVVLVRPLTGLQHESALISARERAVLKGVKEPQLGEPIYDLALMAAILVVGCVDPDSPSNDRQPTFASIDEILANMHPEDVVHLHEHHEAWQDQCSPTNRRISDEDLITKVREVAGADGQGVFMRFSPSTRVLFATFSARMLWPYLEAKFSLGAPSASTGTKSSNESDPSPTPNDFVEASSGVSDAVLGDEGHPGA